MASEEQRIRRTCDECGRRRMTTPVAAGPGVMAYLCRDCLRSFGVEEAAEPPASAPDAS